MKRDTQDELAWLPEHWATFIRERRKVNEPVHTEAKINWGRNRLCPYQSQSSVASYFCALNDVNLRKYAVFWGECLGDSCNHLRFKSRSELERLAQLLDEPREIARTLDASYLEIPACYGNFRLAPSFYELSKTSVSICPICIKHGYHASFHEAPWLSHCPIHNVAIERYPVEGNRHDGYVRQLSKLFRSRNKKWPELFPYETIWKDSRELSGFKKYLKWIRTAQRTAKRLCASSVCYYDSNPYQLEDAGILLGRLAVADPIPLEMHAFLRFPACSGAQSLYPVDVDAINRIESISKRIPFGMLLWFHSKAVSISGRETEHRRMALQLIDHLKNEHTTCGCQWKWDPYSFWQPSTPEHIKWSGRHCPYTYQIEQLKDRWLDFTNPEFGQKRFQIAFHKYTSVLSDLFEYGAALGGEDLAERRPQKNGCAWFDDMRRFKFSLSIEAILDLALTLQLREYGEVVSSWFSAISPDERPREREAAGSVNLLINDNKGWISAWTPVITRRNLVSEKS